ncbi:hypothetical protein EWM64_g6815 [Hericium alpestre]|uniref:Uncharacterized protein n=1 Tax=Hericium alpestre TaxID=135208 RepID=A0A4Y9ZT12_9AGAM|nr:hypothetical protein EWM64_g6815 [Hericium alpestre]
MSSSGWHNRCAVSKKLDIRVSTGSCPRTFPGADKSTRLIHAKQVAFDTQIAAEARAAVKGKRKLAHITGGINDLQGQPSPPFDADDWDDEPADSDIELSAEGDKAEHLHRYAGCIQIELIWQGCLSPTPTTVYTAISLHTLELYHHICARQPRLSMQAWVRIICDMHNVMYRKTL